MNTTSRKRLPPRSEALTWVVYEVDARRQPSGARGVCERSEWDAMQLASPGQLTLVLADIVSESEAERLARGTAGDRPLRGVTRL